MPVRQYTSTDQSGNTTKTKIYSCNSLSTAARIARDNGMRVVKKGERTNANPVSAAIRFLRKKGYKTHKKETPQNKKAAENNPWIKFKKQIKKDYKAGKVKCGGVVVYDPSEYFETKITKFQQEIQSMKTNQNTDPEIIKEKERLEKRYKKYKKENEDKGATEYIVGVGGFLVKAGKPGKKPKSGSSQKQKKTQLVAKRASTRLLNKARGA